ncbi:hypothetical protein ER308_13915 [Egibacter rhizosphaerae]|uniref:ABM domain-containing protein n=1 Tax=Egibacter rhizosphaerae TaxID=1670831 RepID=A0A411YHG0_9ACTN|nr:antibiotic biosynthesis monooxygenase family protein [Egibacter rhizosphaerae]QBI20549.1 hypothetical protein ER308_13915 [Egibacter rhizosphaerae]
MIAFVVTARVAADKTEEWESNWKRNAPIMKANTGHHFRHLLRSTEDETQYMIYGLWDSEEQLRAALANSKAQATITAFQEITTEGPDRVVYELVETDENL